MVRDITSAYSIAALAGKPFKEIGDDIVVVCQ
jgi:hypothetical protein